MLHPSRTLALACLLIGTLAAPTPSAHAVEPAPPEAVAVVEAYFDQVHSGEIRKAVENFWDHDALLRDVFAVHYVKLSADQRIQARQDLQELVSVLQDSRLVRHYIQRIDSERARTASLPDGRALVGIRHTQPDGEVFRQTVLLHRTDHGWFIIDMDTYDRATIRSAIAATFIDSLNVNRGDIALSFRQSTRSLRNSIPSFDRIDPDAAPTVFTDQPKSPEDVLRAFLLAVAANDPDNLEKFAVKRQRADVLTQGEPASDARHAQLKAHFDNLEFERLSYGDILELPNGTTLRIDATRVNTKRQMLVFEGSAMPFTLVYNDDEKTWRVDPLDLIQRRLKARHATAQ
ncbi:MAG: hypothetical protein AAF823_15875 [Planctomycetota bacterium]